MIQRTAPEFVDDFQNGWLMNLNYNIDTHISNVLDIDHVRMILEPCFRNYMQTL